MSACAHRPLSGSATVHERSVQGKRLPRARPSATHNALKWVFCHSVTILFTVGWVVLAFVIYRAYNVDQTRAGTWGCELPRMIPVYRRLEPPIPNSRYDTYLYREGGWDPEVAVGSPVIFLPGHAGDYKQARSVAASVARQFYGDVHSSNYEEPMWARPIDIWAVHYNEDFSAIHAPTLLDQAKYLVATIPRVLETYHHLPRERRPTSVSLVGHSMGGVVARLAIRLDSELPVDVIMTIATPHQQPPANLELGMERLYTKINTPSDALEPLLISICGGTADTQIVSDTCTIPTSLIGPGDGLAVFSSGIPGAWTSVEHQAIVWCEQIRWRIARLLLDMGAASTRKEKLSAAQKWLTGTVTLSHPISPTPRRNYTVPVVHGQMSLIVRLQHPTPSQVANPPFTVLVCNPAQTCLQITPSAHAIPFPNDPKLPFPLPGEGIRNEESAFVIDLVELPSGGTVRIESTAEFTVLAAGSHRYLEARAWEWSSGFRDNAFPLMADVLKDGNLTHLSIRFPSVLVSSLLAWRMELSSDSCTGRTPIVQLRSQPQPVDVINEESRFWLGLRGPITLHSHISGAPFLGPKQFTRGLNVEIFQQPDCKIDRVFLRLDVLATIAKAALRFRVAAITWALGFTALIIYRQFEGFVVSGTVPSVAKVVEADVVYGALIGSMAIIVVMGVQALVPSLSPNLLIGGAHWSFVPLALGLMAISLGLVVVIAGLLDLLTSMAGQVIVSLKRATPTCENTLALKGEVAVGGILLLLVKLVIPIGIAVIALFVILFVSVCRSAASIHAGHTARDRLCADTAQVSRHNLLFAGLLLMTLLMPFYIPGLAVWGRNVWAEIGHPFDEDHAVLPLIPILLFVAESLRERTALTRSDKIMRGAKLASSSLAGIAFLLGARRPFLLPTASSFTFLALSSLLCGIGRSETD